MAVTPAVLRPPPPLFDDEEPAVFCSPVDEVRDALVAVTWVATGTLVASLVRVMTTVTGVLDSPGEVPVAVTMDVMTCVVAGMEDSEMVEVETGWFGSVVGAGVVAVVVGAATGVVVSRIDDETAELMDESMDEESAELVVAGALVGVGVVVVVAGTAEEVVAMMDVLLTVLTVLTAEEEESGVTVELASGVETVEDGASTLVVVLEDMVRGAERRDALGRARAANWLWVAERAAESARVECRGWHQPGGPERGEEGSE